MTLLAQIIASRDLVAAHRPWPRVLVDPGIWRYTVNRLADGSLTLLNLWGEPGAVHMAILGGGSPPVAVLSLNCPDNRYPSVGAYHPPAVRLERTIRDLFGLQPEGLKDPRPWLDHGRWGETQAQAASYPFLPVEGSGLHQIPVGPVHAGIIEPGHFRFTCDGETVVRLEERLGYVHKGVDLLMTGAPLARAAKLAGRVSGDSTVAHSLAFARAVESALAVEIPPRAHWLRAIMAELERIANHLGDVGAICNAAAFSFMWGQCGILREQVLATAATCFQHRLMMDRVIPGGVDADLTGASARQISALTADIRTQFAALMAIYDNKSSLLDRTMGTGVVSAALVHRFAAGGYVGRASSRSFDARRALAYQPYSELDFEVPVLSRGDVHARLWIRVQEIDCSLGMIEQMLGQLPDGPLLTPIPAVAGEGMAVVEAFRGDILTWVRLDSAGLVARCHPRDPSWFQWPLLEACVEGNIIADFPLCNKSFNCTYSGHDL